MKEKPICYTFAGPNGAGKTTFALRYLPAIAKCDYFVNADMIAHGISPLNPDAKQIEAGKLFLREIRKKVKERKNFAFETTLSGKSNVRLFKDLCTDDWEIVLIYLWLPGVAFSSERVKTRVEQGGHNIPQEAISRRYFKSIKNFMDIYSGLADKIFCFDGSLEIPELIFTRDDKGLNINDQEKYKMIMEVVK